MGHRVSLYLPVLVTFIALIPTGCTLAPKETDKENARAKELGQPYERSFDQRQMPELSTEPTWHEVLQRAFLANGELEASYFEWRAALSRIPQAAAYPNTNLAPSFGYLFSGDNLKSWDRTTVNVGFDPMQNLAFPTKVAKAGKIAFEDARAAGMRFAEAKFELQRKVLSAYLDYALNAEKIRIQEENVSLLGLIAQSADVRVQAGAPQQDLLKSQIQLRLAENELANLRSEGSTMRAMLNATLARDANAPLVPPTTLSQPRPIHADDAELIAVAVHQNPDLDALARQVQGRQDALELARMAYIPDINPFAAFTGGISQTIGAMVILPTTFPKIRGAIDEAHAMLQSSQATLRQAHFEHGGHFVVNLYAMRNAERQTTLLRDIVLPKAQQALSASRQAYSASSVTFVDLIDTQRTLLEVRVMIAEAQIEREKRLAELEALAGVDIETLAKHPTTTTEPTTARSEGN